MRVASWAEMPSEARKKLPGRKLPPIIPEHSQHSKQDILQLFYTLEIFRGTMLTHQNDKQRRWHYFGSPEDFNHRVNSPVIDFYQRRRPQEKGGHKCQDRDGQRPARDHEHVDHVKVHPALWGWLVPAGLREWREWNSVAREGRGRKQRGKEKWRTQNEDKDEGEAKAGNGLKKLNRHDLYM